MKQLKSTLTAFAIGVLAFATMSTSANENDESNIMVQIHKTNDSDALVDLNIDGNVEAFSLSELAIGEMREIVTESGKIISLTRNQKGLSITMDGKEIDLPPIGGDMQAHFLKADMPLHEETNENIQVIGDLTEEQIAIIKDGFAAAGVVKEINFTNGHEMAFFFSGDDNHLENVNKWISKDGENIKIIKLNKGDSQIHIKRKMIIIETDEEEN